VERRAGGGRRSSFVIAAAIVLLVSACTSGESERSGDGAPLGLPSGESSELGEALTGTDSEEATTPESVPIERGEAVTNRLAVLDGAGTLLTMDPNGSGRTVIARSDGLEVSQPGFSPDGTRLVWSEFRPLPGVDAFQTFLVTANGDGTNAVETETPFLSFYSFWDPTSNRVAFIGNVSESSVGLGLAELALGARRALPVNAGLPYYISWSPDGKVLLARVSNELILVGETGLLSPVGPVTADFRVPIWSADNQLFFPEGNGSTQELIRLDLGVNETRTALVTYTGQLFAVLDPTGRRIAVQVIEPPGNAEVGPSDAASDLVEASTTDGTDEPGTDREGEPGADEPDADRGGRPGIEAPVLPTGVSVVDAITGEVEVVSDEPVVSFFWSPDGERLLLAAIDENLAGDDAGIDEIVYAGSTLRWDIWEGGQTTAHGRFVPSFVSIQFLLFFEQYAQSHTFWSTDSSSFVYTGQGTTGDSGVWVQDVTSGEGPELVADGVLAIWSPT